MKKIITNKSSVHDVDRVAMFGAHDCHLLKARDGFRKYNPQSPGSSLHARNGLISNIFVCKLDYDSRIFLVSKSLLKMNKWQM